MGTFTVDLTITSISGSPKHGSIFGHSTYYVDTQPGEPTNTTIDYNPNGSCVSLDGATKIPLAGLPSGFNVTAISGIHRVGETNSSFYYGYFGQKTSAGGVSTAIITLIGNVAQTYNPTAIFPLFNIIPQPGVTTKDVIDLFQFFTAELTVTGSDEFTFAEIEDSLQYFGLYTIINSTWILENVTHPNSDNIFNPGDTGKLTSTDNSYDFTTINEIHITKINDDGTVSDTAIPSGDFTVWISVEIEFIVPPTTPTSSPTSPSPITIAGTQFSGTAFLASVSILSTDNSGVYKVVTNQTHDTLYVSAGSSNTTTNVKIPDPYGKTGFIGG